MDGYKGKCRVDGIIGGISGRVSGVILYPNMLGWVSFSPAKNTMYY